MSDVPFSYSGLDPRVVATALGLDISELVKAATFLTGFQLVGMQIEKWNDKMIGLGPLYLESLGENFIRQLEAAPGVGRKITERGVREVWPIVKDLAVSILTDLFRKQVFG